MTERGEWRRQFPVHFRRLSEKFKRWDLIEYEYRDPKGDRRPESRRVQEDTFRVVGKLSAGRRANFLNPIVVCSTAEAASRGQTLALIRPKNVKFEAKKKSAKELEMERGAYSDAAKQGSFFDKELSELEPCPYSFTFKYEDEDGIRHTSTCDDWETAAMYRKFERQYGEAKTLALMQKTFEQDYPAKGMVFAMGTHSRYPDVWLLVGVVRLDQLAQMSMQV